MNRKKTIILAIIIVLIGICSILSSTYGYYTLTINKYGNNTVAVSTSSCANIAMSSGSAITLSGDIAVPIKDPKVLSSSHKDNYKFTFTVSSNCANSPLSVIFVPTTDSSTEIVNSLKYVLVEHDASVPTSGSFIKNKTKIALSNQVKSDLSKQTSKSFTNGYELINTTINNTSKSYDLYVWIDYNEGGQANNSTMNKSFTGYLMVSNLASTGEYLPGVELVVTGLDGVDFASGDNLLDKFIGYVDSGDIGVSIEGTPLSASDLTGNLTVTSDDIDGSGNITAEAGETVTFDLEFDNGNLYAKSYGLEIGIVEIELDENITVTIYNSGTTSSSGITPVPSPTGPGIDSQTYEGIRVYISPEPITSINYSDEMLIGTVEC